jgi:hypothetical protein
MTHEITDEQLTDDSAPCPHCSDGRIRTVERSEGDDESTQKRLCTSCWHARCGRWCPPPVYTKPTHDRLTAEMTDGHECHRPRYRKSGYVVQYGAFPAYDGDEGVRSELDDGSSSYRQFISV